jgi:hypothetical protein
MSWERGSTRSSWAARVKVYAARRPEVLGAAYPRSVNKWAARQNSNSLPVYQDQ